MNYHKTLEQEEKLIEMIGEAELLDALLRAMSVEEKLDYFSFIARMYDIDIENEVEE